MQLSLVQREEFLARLTTNLNKQWECILSENSLLKRMQSQPISKELYAQYMIETFHYTKHNARNQALVGVVASNISGGYQKFCMEHAAEETGHEYMALHDLKAIGIDIATVEQSTPLPETETLIAYLYYISATGNPVQRLGYSFWAESVYGYISPILTKLRSDLKLIPSQMTFFIAHSDIDADHAEEVKKVMLQNCRTPEDWAAVERVMTTSLNLTVQMLTAIDCFHS